MVSHTLLAFFILSAVVISACFAVDRVHLEHGHTTQLSQGWSFTEFKPNSDEKVRFGFALKQQNVDRLEETLKQVSDPNSPKYTHYLTIDEITQLVAPSQETIDTVTQWLQSEGIVDYSTVANKDFIFVETTVGTAERLFATDFQEIKHSSNGGRLVRSAGPYSVPAHVAPHLDFVSGVLAHPVSPKVTSDKKLKASNLPLTPHIIRQQYKVPENLVGTNPGNSMAVAEFQAQYYSPNDLDSFFSQYGPPGGRYNTKVAKVVGTNNPGSPGVEASLDIQYLMGVGLNVTTWFYSIPAFDFFSDLTQWVSNLSSDPDTPLVHSVSYGSQHTFGQPSKDYKHRLDTEFMKLGTRGISVLFASGDSGSGCLLCYEGVASYPATSTYVTSVGATRLLNGAVGPEGAVEMFRSGGGFSKVFDRPSYQDSAVTQWLSSGDVPAKHFFNEKGRGTPDVSALGVGYQVVVNGATQIVAGTSASTPTFAGLVALLNDARMNAGKKPMGFLNPFLYQSWQKNSAAFNDVTKGSNPDACCAGFKCAKGWDPVTGVGTPNYDTLQQLALKA